MKYLVEGDKSMLREIRRDVLPGIPILLVLIVVETGKLKVNAKRGNPIEIATVVVWRVVDTAEAAFQVDSYENYVHVQSEAALRNLATGYPYDAHSDSDVALSSHTAEVSAQLKT